MFSITLFIIYLIYSVSEIAVSLFIYFTLLLVYSFSLLVIELYLYLLYLLISKLLKFLKSLFSFLYSYRHIDNCFSALYSHLYTSLFCQIFELKRRTPSSAARKVRRVNTSRLSESAATVVRRM